MSGDRKIGNNKEFCKMYKSSGRLEKNKARRKATSERRKANTASRIAKRIKQGKTVHSRHKPKVKELAGSVAASCGGSSAVCNADGDNAGPSVTSTAGQG